MDLAELKQQIDAIDKLPVEKQIDVLANAVLDLVVRIIELEQQVSELNALVRPPLPEQKRELSDDERVANTQAWLSRTQSTLRI